MTNYYEILGVSTNASQATIKKAFRDLSKQHHPDLSNNPGSNEKFKRIKEAYDVLIDPEKRDRHDFDLLINKYGHTSSSRAHQQSRSHQQSKNSTKSKQKSHRNNTSRSNKQSDPFAHKQTNNQYQSGPKNDTKSQGYSKENAKSDFGGYSSAEDLLEIDPLLVDAAILYLKEENSYIFNFTFRHILGVNIKRYAILTLQLESLGVINETKNSSKTGVLVSEKELEEILTKHVSGLTKDEFRRKLANKEQELKKRNSGKKSTGSSKSRRRFKKIFSQWQKLSTGRKIKQLFIAASLIAIVFYYVNPLPHNWFNSTSANQTIPQNANGRIVADEGLRVRKLPNTNAQILTNIPHRNYLQVLKTDGPEQTLYGKTANWYQVRYQGQKGWAWGGGIDKLD